ncbi:MAG: SMR family transporter [Nitriliruptorales bacterium]|nr:SMR family transporter [Nitriliruptorales bacterium]
MLASIVLATTGQLLLRAGMEAVGVVDITGASLMSSARDALRTWQVYVGFAAFGASSLLWLITLSRVPLSTAYPFVSLSYVLILTASVVLLNERPSLLSWVGVGFIVLGISIVGLGQR